jgi:hypothetical protein
MIPTNLREEEWGSGPRKKTAESSGREESLPPEIQVCWDIVSGAESEEARWRQRESEMFARIKGLLAASSQIQSKGPEVQTSSQGKDFMGIGAHAKTKPRDESLPLGRDTSTPQGITSASLLGREQEGFVNPVVRRYLESPFVSTAAEFEEEERRAEAKRAEARSKAAERRKAKHRGYCLDSWSSEGEEEELRIPTTVRFRDRIKNFPKFNKPDGMQTWTDFLQQLVELLRFTASWSENGWCG